MKSLNQVTKKLFALSLVGVLALVVLTGCANSKIKTIKKDMTELKTLLSNKGNFIPPEIIIDENYNQDATGIYADSTPDGKVNWKEENDYEMYSEKSKEISNNITLDDKNISFPMNFADLGDKYKEFSNVDFTKLNNDMVPIILENTKTNMKMLIIDAIPQIVDEDMGFGHKAIIVDMFGEGNHDLGLVINTKDRKIVGIYTNGSRFSSERDVKVNGIGVGNTFNEMYAKFGVPTRVQISEMSSNTDTVIMYMGLDTKGNIYIASFTHSDKKFDGKNFVNTKPNIITAVSIMSFQNNK